jgi:hypothetical protein
MVVEWTSERANKSLSLSLTVHEVETTRETIFCVQLG